MIDREQYLIDIVENRLIAKVNKTTGKNVSTIVIVYSCMKSCLTYFGSKWLQVVELIDMFM